MKVENSHPLYQYNASRMFPLLSSQVIDLSKKMKGDNSNPLKIKDHV